MPGSAERDVLDGLPQPGDVLDGKYRIERVVGEGASGLVYAAHHLALDRDVALKVLFADPATDPNAIDRFTREARTAAKIESPNVARVLDTGEIEDGRPFLVMELLVGADLTSTLALHGPLPVAKAAGYVLQALEGLSAAHALGIVHRDLKPANLFIAMKDDDVEVVKILDFGISKVPRTSRQLTTGRGMLGSPSYMAPEQLRDASSIDGRADLWSLAVVLYELLTDALPFDGDGVGEMLAKILDGDHVPLRKRRPDAPAGLERLLERAFQKNPDARFATAAELAAALTPFAGRGLSVVADRIANVELRASTKIAIANGTAVASQATIEKATPAEMTPIVLPTDGAKATPAEMTPIILQPDTAKATPAEMTPIVLQPKPPKASRRSTGWLGFVASVVGAALLVALIAFAVRPGAVATPTILPPPPPRAVAANAPNPANGAPQPAAFPNDLASSARDDSQPNARGQSGSPSSSAKPKVVRPAFLHTSD